MFEYCFFELVTESKLESCFRFRLTTLPIRRASIEGDNRRCALFLPLWTPEFLLVGLVNMIDILLRTNIREVTLLFAVVTSHLTLWNVSTPITTATAATTAATAAAVYATAATAAPAEGRATTAARGTTITGGTIIFDLGM